MCIRQLMLTVAVLAVCRFMVDAPEVSSKAATTNAAGEAGAVAAAAAPAAAAAAAEPGIVLMPPDFAATSLPASTKRFDFAGGRAHRLPQSEYTYVDRVTYTAKGTAALSVKRFDSVTFRTRSRINSPLTGCVAFVAVKHRTSKPSEVQVAVCAVVDGTGHVVKFCDIISPPVSQPDLSQTERDRVLAAGKDWAVKNHVERRSAQRLREQARGDSTAAPAAEAHDLRSRAATGAGDDDDSGEGDSESEAESKRGDRQRRGQRTDRARKGRGPARGAGKRGRGKHKGRDKRRDKDNERKSSETRSRRRSASASRSRSPSRQRSPTDRSPDHHHRSHSRSCSRDRAHHHSRSHSRSHTHSPAHSHTQSHTHSHSHSHAHSHGHSHSDRLRSRWASVHECGHLHCAHHEHSRSRSRSPPRNWPMVMATPAAVAFPSAAACSDPSHTVALQLLHQIVNPSR